MNSLPLIQNRIQIFVNEESRLGVSWPKTLDSEEEIIEFMEEMIKLLKAPRTIITKEEDI